MPVRRPALWLGGSLLLVLVLLVLGLRVGSYTTSYSFILNTFQHYNPADPAQLVLVQLRLPRLLLALLAGASLALSGYLLQTLVTNPLADPYLLGTASGASLGAIACYVLVPSLTFMGVYLPPVAALAGAFAATLLVVVLEPVPAAMRVGGVFLLGVDQHHVVRAGQFVHAGAGGEIERILLAAVEHEDQRAR